MRSIKKVYKVSGAGDDGRRLERGISDGMMWMKESVCGRDGLDWGGGYEEERGRNLRR